MEWVFSGVLAVVFFITGLYKVFRYTKSTDRFPWVKHLPRSLVQAIGVFEVLGALGLILPALTGFYPWLTPVAALALALLTLIAVAINARQRESDAANLNVLLLIFLIFVVYLRWPLMP